MMCCTIIMSDFVMDISRHITGMQRTYILFVLSARHCVMSFIFRARAPVLLFFNACSLLLRTSARRPNLLMPLLRRTLPIRNFKLTCQGRI